MREICLFVGRDPERNEKALKALKRLKGVKVKIVASNGYVYHDDDDDPWIEEDLLYVGVEDIREFVRKELVGRSGGESTVTP